MRHGQTCSEDGVWGSVLFFHHGGGAHPRDGTQAFRLGSRYLYLLRLLVRVVL